MMDFPVFMKQTASRISAAAQNTRDVEGYYYESPRGGQMAFWSCPAARESAPHKHPFDEYMVVLSGEYTVCSNYDETVLHAGDELMIPAGTLQWGRCIAGTRTIHAFGGARIPPEQSALFEEPAGKRLGRLR